jgi:hypothetical protein
MRRSFVARVLAAYALCRTFSVVLLAIVARYQAPVAWTGPHPNYFSMTVLWDGFWYGQIATVGYPSTLPIDAATGAVQQNAWAFYPAFPMMSRVLMKVTGLGFPVVGSTLALLLGFGAVVVMGLLLRDQVGPKVALAAVVVFAACPVSPSLQIAYTESLGVLLLCGFLWAISKEHWLLTAWLALLIGLSRAMALPLAVVALVAVFLRWRRRQQDPISVGERWSALAALGGCGAAGLLWPLMVSIGVGTPLGYTETMGAWSYGGSVQLLRPWLSYVAERPLGSRPGHGTANLDPGLQRLPDPGRCPIDQPVPPSPATVSAHGGFDRRRLAGQGPPLDELANRVPDSRGPGRAGVVGMGAAAVCPAHGLAAIRAAGGQRPWNVGLSLARNAATAAAWSWLPPVILICSASWASDSLSG